jgi:hypothetical protein
VAVKQLEDVGFDHLGELLDHGRLGCDWIRGDEFNSAEGGAVGDGMVPGHHPELWQSPPLLDHGDGLRRTLVHAYAAAFTVLIVYVYDPFAALDGAFRAIEPAEEAVYALRLVKDGLFCPPAAGITSGAERRT